MGEIMIISSFLLEVPQFEMDLNAINLQVYSWHLANSKFQMGFHSQAFVDQLQP
jgi:hypothetical protein